MYSDLPSVYTRNVQTPPKPAQGGWDAKSIAAVKNLGAGAPVVGSLGGWSPSISAPAPPPAPAVTTPAPAPAAPSGRWSVPDYSSMIPGDWEVTDAQAQGNQARAEAEAAFQKALRQAFIDYGGDSARLGDYAKYIDAPTIEAARANKFSQTAQNLQAMTKALARSRAALAARGILSSGQTTADTRAALDARELADYSALRSFLGGADKGTASLADVRQQIADRIRAARASAAARLAQQYPATWLWDTPPAPPPVPEAPTTVPGARRSRAWDFEF